MDSRTTKSFSYTPGRSVRRARPQDWVSRRTQKPRSETNSSSSSSAPQRMPLVEERSEVVLDGSSVLCPTLRPIKYNFQHFITYDLLKRGSSPMFASEEAVQEKIHEDYTEVLLEQAATARTDVDAHLAASQHIFQEFLDLQVILADANEVLREGHGDLNLSQLIFEMVENYLLPRTMYPQSCSKTTPQEAAKVISWIELFHERVKMFCPNVQTSSEWKSEAKKLLDLYLDRGVRGEMRDLLRQSRRHRRSSTLQQTSNGYLVSGACEDIAFIVESQLKIAEEFLPVQHVPSVLDACCQEIADMVSDMMLEVETNWRILTCSHYCCIVNDTARLTEFLEERNDKYLTDTKYEEEGDNVVRDLAEMSLHATNFLCERILFDLQEPKPILTSVGDLDWQADAEGVTIQTIIATFIDYFEDIEEWIDWYYFPKILKRCFEKTLETYVESFYLNTMAHGVRDADEVARKLNQDYTNLMEFFHDPLCARYYGKAGFLCEKQINDRLAVLLSMSRVCGTNLPKSKLSQDVTNLLRCTRYQTGQDALVILHLVGFRTPLQPEEKIDWIRIISRAERSFGGNGDVTIPIPDLRFSRFVHSVGVNSPETLKRLSVSSFQKAEETCKLLKTTRPNRIRAFVNRRRVVPVFTPNMS